MKGKGFTIFTAFIILLNIVIIGAGLVLGWMLISALIDWLGRH
jgi:hypothetical protein